MDMGGYYVNSLAPEIAQRYHEKLQLFCDNVDPYGLDTTHCSTDVVDMPNVSAASIHSYLKLSKCPYSGRAGTTTTSDDAGGLGRSGGIDAPLDPDNYTVRVFVKSLDGIAIVLGEMQILDSGELLNPWFVAFPDGYVLCAHCTCAAGTNETCGHIGALLRNVMDLKAMQAEREAVTSDAADGEDGELVDDGGNDDSQLVAARVVKVKMEPAEDEEVAEDVPQANGSTSNSSSGINVSVRELNAMAAKVAAKQRQQQQQQQQPTSSRAITVNSVAAAAAAVASLPKPIVLNFSNGMRKINIITAKTITSTSRINGIPIRTQMTSSDGSPVAIVPMTSAVATALTATTTTTTSAVFAGTAAQTR